MTKWSLYVCTALFVCTLVQEARAQSLLDGLLGKSSADSIRIQTPEKRQKAALTKQLKQYQDALNKRIKEEPSRAKQLETERKRYLKMTEQYRKSVFAYKDEPAIATLLTQLAVLAEQNAFSMRRKASANASYLESLRAIVSILQDRLSHNNAALAARIKRLYPEAIQLSQALVTIQQQLAESQRAFSKSRRERRLLQKQKEKSRTMLDKARRDLVSLQRVPAPTSMPAPSSRPTSRPARQIQNLKQIQQAAYAKNLRETKRMLFFQYHRAQSSWIRLRLKDEEVDAKTEEHRIALYKAIIAQMAQSYKALRSKSRDGLWYFRALQWSPAFWEKIWTRERKILSKSPYLIRNVVKQRIKALKQLPPASWMGLLLLLLLVPTGLLWTLRQGRRLVQSQIDLLSARVEAHTITQQLWGLLRLVFQLISIALPYGLAALGVLILFAAARLPESWAQLTLSTLILFAAIQGIWLVANQLFSADAKQRLLAALDDRSARNFRRVSKGLAIVILFYTPLLLFAYQLSSPEPLIQWLNVFFYAFVLLGFLLVFMNQDGILALIPSNHVIGRILIIFIHRFYLFVLLTATGIYAVYVWGYINFATFLTQGVVLTTMVISIAYMLYRLSWIAGLWVLGFAKGEEGLVNVEKKWGRNLLRLFRTLSGGILLLSSVILLLEVWGIGNGLKTIQQIFTTPFVQVKETQINLLSLLKLGLAIVLAFWFSGYLRRQCSEYLYPALRISQANQHASNTALGYIILILGLLSGLQWMGVGIGVLAVFAGIIGIGVGFGIQNIMNNFISGLIITFGQPIKVGDLIEVDGVMGEVKEISGRSTTIETFDLRVVLIPNSEILTKKVINWSMGAPCVYAPLSVGVAYGSDVELVLKTLQDAADAHPRVLKEPPPALRFGDFGDNALAFKLWIAVTEPLDRFEVLSDLRVDLDKRFRALGIVISFPQRDIHLNPQLEEALIERLAAPPSAATIQAVAKEAEKS